MARWWMALRDRLLPAAGGRRGTRAGRGPAKDAAKGVAKGAAKGSAAAAPIARPRLLPLGVGALLLALHLVLFPPVPDLDVDFPAAGEIAEDEIRAPFDFVAPLLERDVELERLERVVAEPPILRLETSADAVEHARLELWFEAMDVSLRDTSTELDRKIELLALQFPQASSAGLRRLLTTAEPDSLVPRLRRAWRELMRGGVVDVLPVGRYTKVAIADGDAGRLVEMNLVTTQVEIEKRLGSLMKETGLGPLDQVEAAAVMRHLIEPNLIYDPAGTEANRNSARQSVPTTRQFSLDERIVDQGVRVSEQQARFLDELASLLTARGSGDDGTGRLVRHLRRGLLVGLGLLMYGWLAGIHFPRRLTQLRFLMALGIVLALFLGGAALALSRPGLGPMAVPIVLLSLLVTVLYKGRIGYTTTLLAVTLLAVLPDVTAGQVFAWYMLGMVTVLLVRRVQKRSQFYQAALLLTVLSVVLAFLLGIGFPERAWSANVVGIFVPALSVAFGLFLLPVVEPLIGVCSDLTLLELSDLNHPLLQRMALATQGTYHHSQVVGQLAEHAARAIDANALLTRVGALFHDIGKMEKPEYYVENQRPNQNKHDELSPSMSALVIAAHVKDGIELGRRWRLPRMVIDFIPEHHGTMVMEYFYHKALEDEGNETVKVDDFRYPGPKPQSRETAILMCADAVEAATRSLAKPTPSRIKEITKQIIDKRMLSGELDDSGLSLSDIARIREAFIPLLTGIHHARIAYPGQQERDGERATERKVDRKART